MKDFNVFEIISAGAAILGAVSGAAVQLVTGQPVSLPPIRFTAGGKHYEIDATAKQV